MLRILRAAEGETRERTGEPIFEGQVHGRSLGTEDSDHLRAALVYFAAGHVPACTVTPATSCSTSRAVSAGWATLRASTSSLPGDSVLIPAGHDHWHGAAGSGSLMTHVTVQAAGSETTVLDTDRG